MGGNPGTSIDTDLAQVPGRPLYCSTVGICKQSAAFCSQMHADRSPVTRHRSSTQFYRKKTMIHTTDKTIPYRPSAADLENLRRLRRRTHPALSIRDDLEEEKTFGQFDTEDSSPDHPIQK